METNLRPALAGRRAASRQALAGLHHCDPKPFGGHRGTLQMTQDHPPAGAPPRGVPRRLSFKVPRDVPTVIGLICNSTAISRVLRLAPCNWKTCRSRSVSFARSSVRGAGSGKLFCRNRAAMRKVRKLGGPGRRASGSEPESSSQEPRISRKSRVAKAWERMNFPPGK